MGLLFLYVIMFTCQFSPSNRMHDLDNDQSTNCCQLLDVISVVNNSNYDERIGQ